MTTVLSFSDSNSLVVLDREHHDPEKQTNKQTRRKTRRLLHKRDENIKEFSKIILFRKLLARFNTDPDVVPNNVLDSLSSTQIQFTLHLLLYIQS